MPTFNQRVQALPTELYDEVLALTFTPDSVVMVDRDYKPPATLQVSRATREEFKTMYFCSHTTFYVDSFLFLRWMKTLSDAKVEINSEIRLTESLMRTTGRTLDDLRPQIESALNLVGYLHLNFASTHVANCLNFQLAFGEPERTVWLRYLDFMAWRSIMTFQGNAKATDYCESKFRA